MYKHKFYLLTLLAFSLLGIKALFHPGLFTAHDIWHQVVRLYYYSQAVNDGQIPPYWVGQLANHFGYPLFLFSYQLPWIVSILLLKIGLGFSDSIKALFIISYIASGFTMYAFIYNLLKDKLAALLSSILYLWLPYHFLVTFVSASIGIAFVFIFLPLLFLGIYLLDKKSKNGAIILGLGLSGIILSHIVHLVFLLPTILIFTIWKFKITEVKSRFIKNIAFGLVLGLLISSFYLLPAFYYNQFSRVHKEEGITKLYERNFINFKQLFYSKWGYSPIVNNAKNGEISFQLGFAQWISAFLLLFILILNKMPGRYKSLSIYLLISLLLNILFLLDISKPVWTQVVKFVSIDFPFRFLLPIAFMASICAGVILINAKKKIKNLLFVSLIVIAVFTNRNHINVNQYTNFPISTYLDLPTEITTNTFNEYLPADANPQLLNKPWNEIIGENLSVSSVYQTTNQLSFEVKVPTPQNVSLGQFYFPGQTLYVDNKLSQMSKDKQGRIAFLPTPGNHIVKIIYKPTLLILFSKFLTLVGILLMILLFFKQRGNLSKKSTLN